MKHNRASITEHYLGGWFLFSLKNLLFYKNINLWFYK
jgi:hypothetical protein